ncbi:MAG: 50S ribosomal protein L9 [Puniceicoccales bacterium]|jgi:large subunit ribosomal protein L9|nr:50S ribosomal protein L9 [Puniceicoccales bacterium]
MATCEILLLTPVSNLGDEGDCVRVKAGYARNFLVPQRKALSFSKANERQIRALIKRREERDRKAKEDAMLLAKHFGQLRVVMAVRTGENGKLFGSVSASDLLEKLAEKSIAISRDQLHLPHPLKELGQHSVEVRLHRDVSATFVVEIVSENPVVGGNG